MKTNFIKLAFAASFAVTLCGCASSVSSVAHQITGNSQEANSTSASNTSKRSISFTLREGKQQWDFGSLLRFPVSVSMPSTKYGHCQFEGEPFEYGGEASGPKTDIKFDVIDGTSFTVVPLQKTSTGVLVLIRIEKSSSNVNTSVISWEVGSTTKACSMPQGTFKTDFIQTSRHLEYGKPEKLKVSDNSIYEITATPGPF